MRRSAVRTRYGPQKPLVGGDKGRIFFKNMNSLDKNTAGVVFGIFLGLFHAFWAFLVLIGWAQSIMNWTFGLHFINPPYVIGAFNGGVALLLVAATAIIGYIFGWVFAALWNWLHWSRTR